MSIESIPALCKMTTKSLKQAGISGTYSFDTNRSTIYLRRDKKVIFGIAIRKRETGLVFWNQKLGWFKEDMLAEILLQAAL